MTVDAFSRGSCAPIHSDTIRTGSTFVSLTSICFPHRINTSTVLILWFPRKVQITKCPGTKTNAIVLHKCKQLLTGLTIVLSSKPHVKPMLKMTTESQILSIHDN